MKKFILFTALFCAVSFLSCNVSQAAPPPPPGGGHHGGHYGAMHKPPAHGHRPPPPPMMHRPPMHHGYHHGGHHLRRSFIYTNYGWGSPYYSWRIGGYYPVYHPAYYGSHVSIGFGF